MPVTLRSEKTIESPLPYFSEAAEAARGYLNARREHLLLSAEIRARHESKRAALFGAAALFGFLALALFLFWMAFQVYESGVAPWAVALICLGALGAIGGAFAWLGRSLGERKPA